jgi:TRAP-type transport system periplasmic protein
MKTKILFLVFASFIIISLVFISCSSANTGDKDNPVDSENIFTFKYADHNSSAGWEATQAANPWLDDITSATNDRVQFETYFGESLCKGTDAWDSVKNGVADLSWMFHGYWANKTTLADVITLPFLPFKSGKQASGILWQLYEKYPSIQQQFGENQVLCLFSSDPYFLITTEKQVKTLEDFKGLNLRVTSGPPIEMMKSLGANPVTKGMPDTYIAMQKGEIDGMLTCWEALLSWRQYEVAKYYTYFPSVTVYFSVAMNHNSWNELPSDLQKQVVSVGGSQGALFWGENQFDEAKPTCKDKIDEAGLEMIEYTVSEEELKEWTEIAGKPIWDSWVKARTEEGYDEAQEILDTTLNLIETYNP